MKDLIKQPNGKYCMIGYQGKLDFINYTEQDIINLYVEEAKKRYGKRKKLWCNFKR